MNEQQITIQGFDPPTPEERLRAEQEALRRAWEEMEAVRTAERKAEERREIDAAKDADPLELTADLLRSVSEILFMMEAGSRPANIARVCRSARLHALKLEAATGDSQSGELAKTIQGLIDTLEAQDEQEERAGIERGIVFTPDHEDPETGEAAPGKEFSLPEDFAAYKKENPAGAEDLGPQPTAAEIVKANVESIAFILAAITDPGEALLSDGIPDGYYKRYEAAHFARLVHEVARKTGASPAQIANKETRTEEQQRLLAEIQAGEQLSRLEQFAQSCYVQAVTAIRAKEDTPEIKGQAVLYFFACHSEIRPTSTEKLTPEQLEEVKGIYKKLTAFYRGKQQPTEKEFYAFIEQENPDPNAAETIMRKLPELQGIRPKSHTMPNNRLMNAMQEGLINAGAHDLIVANENKVKRQKEITAYTMVSYDPGETQITITDAKLTEYERQVSDAIVSLWIEADRRKLSPVFTPDMIFRAMPGGSDKPSAQQKGAITRAVEKFRRIHVVVDATEELRRRGKIGPRDSFKLDNFYLSATHAELKVKNGGQTVNAYQLEAEPIILTYCKMTGQLLTVPAKYIAIEKVKDGAPSGELIAMSPTRQAMTGYIVRRIRVMQRDAEKAKDRKRSYDMRRNRYPEQEPKPLAAFQEQSRVISFDKLFSDVGIVDQDRNRAKENRNFCFDVLDYQIAVGNISGYKKKNAGRQITGVEIIL